jgi:hypothetical protein
MVVIGTTRWRVDDWRLVKAKAKAAGLSYSEYIRAKALNRPLLHAA